MASICLGLNVLMDSFNSLRPSDMYMCQGTRSSLVKVMVVSWAQIQYKYVVLPVYENPIVEIRWLLDGLISTVGFPILLRWHLYIESGPFMDLFHYQIQC